MNKKFIFVLTCAFFVLFSEINAQTNKVPSFRMIKSNGKVFRAEYLPFEKPIIIIYFSPDCDDCQQLTSELLFAINDF